MDQSKTSSATDSRMYPVISNLKNNANPNRLYAVPILGGLIKFFMLIPVVIVLWVIGVGLFFLGLVNSFIVLFTGVYWGTYYNLNVFYLKLSLKLMLFAYGASDKYPGFDANISDGYNLNITLPQSPNRLFAIPLLGFLIRVIMIIPFAVYESVIGYAMAIAALCGSFVVLFAGEYPEWAFELVRDGIRLQFAIGMWFAGLSDTYPSFWISMNHKNAKIIFIIIAALLMILNYTYKPSRVQNRNYMYNNYYNSQPGNYNYQNRGTTY